LTNSTVNELNALNDFAIEKVLFAGDANGGGILPASSPPSAYTSEDATLIGRVFVGANGSTGFDATPMVDPAIVGDASGDGTLSPFDASLIFQEAAGFNTAEVPDETAPGTGSNVAFDPALSVPDNISAVTGHNVVVPVNVTVEPAAPAGFFSATYTVTFDPAQLDFVSATNGSDFPFPTWTQTANVTSPGVVQVATGTFTTTSGNNGGNPMQLSQLTFAVHNAATLGSSPLSIAPVDPNEDGLIWTNNPADDGSVSITRLVGDYNFDGIVDDSDYVIWRKKNGSSVPAFTSADGNGDGHVDGLDYTLWRNHFGDTTPGSGAGSSLEIAAANFTAAASGSSTPEFSLESNTIEAPPLSRLMPAVPSAGFATVDSALELHQTARTDAAVEHVARTIPFAVIDRQSVRDEALVGLVEFMDDSPAVASGAHVRNTQLGILANAFAMTPGNESLDDFADRLRTDAQHDRARDTVGESGCEADAGAIDQLFAELDGASVNSRFQI
jgi:hypothetical protein